MIDRSQVDNVSPSHEGDARRWRRSAVRGGRSSRTSITRWRRGVGSPVRPGRGKTGTSSAISRSGRATDCPANSPERMSAHKVKQCAVLSCHLIQEQATRKVSSARSRSFQPARKSPAGRRRSLDPTGPWPASRGGPPPLPPARPPAVTPRPGGPGSPRPIRDPIATATSATESRR